MSRSLPTEFLKNLEMRVAIAGRRKVARRFVPGYSSSTAIRVSPVSPRRAFARRQLARLIDPRRADS